MAGIFIFMFYGVMQRVRVHYMPAFLGKTVVIQITWMVAPAGLIKTALSTREYAPIVVVVQCFQLLQGYGAHQNQLLPIVTWE